jgi:hypothetical protein
MNTQTGQIYRGEEILAARERGEQIVEVSAEVAALMELGRIEMDKDERRAAWRKRWFTPQSGAEA